MRKMRLELTNGERSHRPDCGGQIILANKVGRYSMPFEMALQQHLAVILACGVSVVWQNG